MNIWPAVALAVILAAPIHARAEAINTAGETGAYHRDFCPGLERDLKAAKFDYACATSAGSIDNIKRTLANPKQIGFAQFDIFARETAKLPGAPLAVIRQDFGRECLFMVTRNKTIKSYGEVAALAEHLRFVLPRQGSGSAATFEFLQRIDPEGLGRAKSVTYAADADAALAETLDGAEDMVTLFVQFPDPENPRFKLIDDKAGQFIPVIDRAVLRQEINGQKVYYAQETEITSPKFLKKGESVITSCTPVTLFTGSPERVPAGVERANHIDMIRTIAALDRAALLPPEGFFTTLLKRTKELSADGLEQAVQMSEQARKDAAPLINRLKEETARLRREAEELKRRAEEEADKLLGERKTR
ncbi:MAG: hypothetical protein NW215_11375 [Hyphomicrobiales bacterium]|nr:hypothetical protein [Hyphomicrobiales bacterium]